MRKFYKELTPFNFESVSSCRVQLHLGLHFADISNFVSLPHTLQAKELTAPFPACLRRRVKGIRTYIFLHVEYFSIDLMKHTRTRGSDHPTPLDPPLQTPSPYSYHISCLKPHFLFYRLFTFALLRGSRLGLNLRSRKMLS